MIISLEKDDIVYKCIVCQREFRRKTSRNYEGLTFRGSKCVTCCHKCSRIYSRIRHHVLHTGMIKKILQEYRDSKRVKLELIDVEV